MGTERFELPVALDDNDRRRIFWASVVTVIALPSIWIVSRDSDSAAPDVAVADVDLDVGADDVDATTDRGSESNLPLDPPSTDTPPVFLGGPTGAPGANRNEVAVPAEGASYRQTTASYRRDNIDVTTCIADDIASGGTITVVNMANNRSIECTARLAPSGASTGLVMHRDAFLQLADLTDAPIRVEIRP
jgi:hypothetical protein